MGWINKFISLCKEFPTVTGFGLGLLTTMFQNELISFKCYCFKKLSIFSCFLKTSIVYTFQSSCRFFINCFSLSLYFFLEWCITERYLKVTIAICTVAIFALLVLSSLGMLSDINLRVFTIGLMCLMLLRLLKTLHKDFITNSTKKIFSNSESLFT